MIKSFFFFCALTLPSSFPTSPFMGVVVGQGECVQGAPTSACARSMVTILSLAFRDGEKEVDSWVGSSETPPDATSAVVRPAAVFIMMIFRNSLREGRPTPHTFWNSWTFVHALSPCHLLYSSWVGGVQ